MVMPALLALLLLLLSSSVLLACYSDLCGLVETPPRHDRAQVLPAVRGGVASTMGERRRLAPRRVVLVAARAGGANAA